MTTAHYAITTTSLLDNPFTQRFQQSLPMEMCAFAAGMSEDEFDATYSPSGDIFLGAFTSQPASHHRTMYIASLAINGEITCCVAEAAGAIQAMCTMLDDLGYHLEIDTYRQRELPADAPYRYASFIEVTNHHFTQWAIGYGTTSEEANLRTLITAANQMRNYEGALDTR